MNLSDFIAVTATSIWRICANFSYSPRQRQSEHTPDIERGATWVSRQCSVSAGFKNIEIVPTGRPRSSTQESLEAPGKSNHSLLRAFRTSTLRYALSLTSPPFEPTVRNAIIWPGTGRRQRPGPHPPESVRILSESRLQLPIRRKVLIEGE